MIKIGAAFHHMISPSLSIEKEVERYRQDYNLDESQLILKVEKEIDGDTTYISYECWAPNVGDTAEGRLEVEPTDRGESPDETYPVIRDTMKADFSGEFLSDEEIL